ncbi:hypothetical protein C7E16_14460 [Acinetobacter radioresistens]|uniref:hypothetical protein n=2 Tax=Acinetobacter radioresistens TaxID=40216 RepID=UPI000D0BDD99|nr:hypothetical protein [Acinetobacter radioresistens]PSD34586.1 hypothetical protein C7E16_14460 [Acinetobacter radioresistens]
MKLIRVSTSETVALSDGFLWSDEFDWNGIEQNIKPAIDGTPIIQEGKWKSGRPITLTADKNMAWLKRHIVSQLKDFSLLQGENFILAFEYPHDRRQFNVKFHHAANAIEARPVKDHPSVSEDDYYNVTLRFIEVGELYSGN